MSRSPVRVSEPPRPRTQATAARLAPPDPRKVPYTECGTFRTHRSHPYARGSPNGTAAASAQVHNASARLAARGAPGLDEDQAPGGPRSDRRAASAFVKTGGGRRTAPIHGGCCGKLAAFASRASAEAPAGRRAFRRVRPHRSGGGGGSGRQRRGRVLVELEQLCVAVISRHSERQAALPRRWKRSILRLNFVSPNTGSIIAVRLRYSAVPAGVASTRRMNA
jgi:hypothetical protein